MHTFAFPHKTSSTLQQTESQMPKKPCSCCSAAAADKLGF